MQQIIQWLTHLATDVPLELFVFIGTVIEEIIAPIPTPVVLGTAGYLAHQAGQGWFFLFWLATVSSVGKTLVSVVFYFLGDKAEDFFVHRCGKFFGISPTDIQKAERWMNKGWWDEVVLVGLRIVPIVPTFAVSIVCGVLRVKMRTFIWTTFIGTLVRSFIILGVGALGTQYAVDAWKTTGSDLFQDPLTVASGIIGLILGAGIALYLRKKMLRRTPQKE